VPSRDQFADRYPLCDLIPVIEDSPGTARHAVRGPGYHARQGWFGRTVTGNKRLAGIAGW
jgi:hypothetical protein